MTASTNAAVVDELIWMRGLATVANAGHGAPWTPPGHFWRRRASS